MNLKLTSKDLINIGIFTALYLGISILVSSFVVVPIMQLVMTPIIALLTAPVYMLYIAKTGKPFCITITGIISSVIVGLLVYGNVYCFAVNLGFFLLAELIAYLGGYKSYKLNALSFIVVSFWTMGEAGLFWFAQEYMVDLSIASGYSREWTDGVVALSTPLNLILVCAAIIIGAVISLLISNSMFKKHFKKAGIV